MERQEHTTALFVAAAYYWWIGDEASAESIINIALFVANFRFVADA